MTHEQRSKLSLLERHHKVATCAGWENFGNKGWNLFVDGHFAKGPEEMPDWLAHPFAVVEAATELLTDAEWGEFFRMTAGDTSVDETAEAFVIIMERRKI